MKNNLSYYPHYADSHEHPKFKLLRSKYGWAGEGKFWALNNIIAKAEDTVLDLTKKYNKASVAVELDFTLDEFDEFLRFLAEDCELIIYREDEVTTEIVKKSLEEVSQKREAARLRKRPKPEKQQSSPEPVKSSPEPVTKKEEVLLIKESKVKEIKEKESRVFTRPQFEEVMNYFYERGSGEMEAQKYFDFYESKGWMVGKVKMKDWQAAVRNWLRNDFQKEKSSGKKEKVIETIEQNQRVKYNGQSFNQGY